MAFTEKMVGLSDWTAGLVGVTYQNVERDVLKTKFLNPDRLVWGSVSWVQALSVFTHGVAQLVGRRGEQAKRKLHEICGG